MEIKKSAVSSSKKGASPVGVLSLAFMVLILVVGSASAVTFPTFYQNDNNNANGSNETVIVVGSNAAQSDRDAAETIANSIRGNTGTAGNGSNGNNGAFLIQRTSNNLNMGESIRDIYTTIDDDELPRLLAEDTFVNDQNDEYDYEQKIDFANNLNLTWFQDDEVNDENPVIGIEIPADQPILNYTLDFRENAESDLSGDDLVDLEDSDITILGGTYRILSASITPDTIELIGGASTDTIRQDDTETYVIAGEQYQVTPVFINQDQTRLEINGRLTNALREGDTYRVNSEVQIGVRSILYDARDSGVSQVEITLGAQNIKLQDGENVEVNGDDVENLTAFIDISGSGTTRQLERIVLSWIPEDDAFLTEDTPLVMPVFGNLQLTMADFVTPASETLNINTKGDDTLTLGVNVEDGRYNLPILSGDGDSFTTIGENTNRQLATSTTNTLSFDRDTDRYLVASWSNGNEAESYILEVTNINDNNGETEVTVRNVVSRDSDTDSVGRAIDLGNVELTIASANEANNTATFTINSGGSFNKLYTEQGLAVMLPVDTTGNATGGINLAANPTSYALQFVEEDEDDDVEQGQSFNITTSWNSNELGVTGTGGVAGNLAGEGFIEQGDGSNEYVAYINSPLSTRIMIDTDANPDTAEITYYGSETYGRVYIGGSDLPSGNSTSRGNVRIVSDSNTASFGNAQIISVGGSCVNRITAQALGLSFSTCGQEFTDETDVGQGEYLVQTVRSPFTSGNATARTLTIVAGYDAADTTRAASEFDNIDFDIQAGNKYNSANG